MSVEQFNKAFPIGSEVKYFSIKGLGKGKDTAITSQAWIADSGDAVVKIKGVSGYVSIDHIAAPT